MAPELSGIWGKRVSIANVNSFSSAISEFVYKDAKVIYDVDDTANVAWPEAVMDFDKLEYRDNARLEKKNDSKMKNSYL